MNQDGNLAHTGHPAGLGSALTNQYITTDYSEALLEFVTPAYGRSWEVQQFLCDVHQFTYSRLDDELLWAGSMPCVMEDDDDIPIARYGTSNVGRMKTIYRRGLGFRYGRRMQTISGVHFNYSLPLDFWSALKEEEGIDADAQTIASNFYMGLVRNFRRVGWIVLYLFGSSPALCKSFLPDGGMGLEELDSSSWYSPYATSLRMSGLGYQNNAQAGLSISANRLDSYIAELTEAINTPSPQFEQIGVEVDGEYRQLNANRLQIENEYYSSIRPKRRAKSGERPTLALQRRGVEYVEIRALDVNMASPVGIDQAQMRFLETLLILCAMSESPPIDSAEQREIDERQALVAERGREPGLTLTRNGQQVSIGDWSSELLEQTSLIAEQLDDEASDYRAAAESMGALARRPEGTPSALLLDELRASGQGFFSYALEVSQRHSQYFRDLMPLDDPKEQLFAREAADSLDRQKALEADDSVSFDAYLSAYYAD